MVFTSAMSKVGLVCAESDWVLIEDVIFGARRTLESDWTWRTSSRFDILKRSLLNNVCWYLLVVFKEGV